MRNRRDGYDLANLRPDLRTLRESYHKYNELMQEIRRAFPDIIRQYRSLLIYEQLKFENNFIRYSMESGRRP